MAPGRKRTSADTAVPPEVVNLNEVIAYNFRRARELRGLTQDEAAVKLEKFLGQRLPQASISALERSYGGDKRREFDAQEILAFACAFDVPLLWFFLPPPKDTRRLQRTSDHVNELYTLTLGREDQLDELYARFRELGMKEPGEQDAALARLFGTATPITRKDYRHRRKEMLLALLDDHADRLDATAEEMGAFFDHLRQVGIRGLVAEKLNDSDYVIPPAGRRKEPQA
ncbi:MAG: helix-turn-helix domain-containing protein [Sporichthyaceae bacterium]